jgi:putative sugar O-methyltransferase
LLPSHELGALAAQGWLNADLGSVMDLNLINVYADFPGPRSTTILEVGGGYGRLAEAFYNTFSETMKYVLVDAVPASIMYAYLNMSKCTSAKVGFYYNHDELDLNKFDVYVMPSWHFKRLNNSEYDISINVESMQEMAQVHVDFYMGLFDAVTRPDGLIYISNGRRSPRFEGAAPGSGRSLLDGRASRVVDALASTRRACR